MTDKEALEKCIKIQKDVRRLRLQLRLYPKKKYRFYKEFELRIVELQLIKYVRYLLCLERNS